jgi:hypothetical protein
MPVKKSPCVYERLPNGVHKITLLRANMRGMEALIGHLQTAFDATPDGETALLLIDHRPEGIPSLPLTIPALEAFIENRTSTPRLRVAYLHDYNVQTSLLEMFLKRLNIVATRRFFAGDAEDEALAWLLSGDE